MKTLVSIVVLGTFSESENRNRENNLYIKSITNRSWRLSDKATALSSWCCYGKTSSGLMIVITVVISTGFPGFSVLRMYLVVL